MQKEKQLDLVKTIKKYKLEKYEKEIIRAARAGILITTTKPDKYARVGNTRFGGIPDLPEGMKWPIATKQDSREEPSLKNRCLHFICQINLEDIAKFKDIPVKLPQKGILYLFGDPMEMIDSKVIFFSGNTKKLKKYQVSDSMKFLYVARGADYYKPYQAEFKSVINIPSADMLQDCDAKSNGGLEIGSDDRKIYEKFERSLMPNRKKDGEHYMFGYQLFYGGDNANPEKLAAKAARDKKMKKPEDWICFLEIHSDKHVRFKFENPKTYYIMINKKDKGLKYAYSDGGSC